MTKHGGSQPDGVALIPKGQFGPDSRRENSEAELLTALKMRKDMKSLSLVSGRSRDSPDLR
jgi:hypothetical protein